MGTLPTVATAELGTRGIVTPEAVLLEFEPARLGTRSLQMAVDLAIQATALIFVVVVLGLVASGVGSASSVAIILTTILSALVIIGYPIACESLLAGRTVGMMATGLRVVTVEGAPIRFRHAAIRGFLMIVDFWILLGGIGATVMLFSRDSQRLGDLAAGTLVLRERTTAKTDSAITFLPPPGWEPYAASLDPGRMTEEQYGLVRSFLLRVQELSPAARHDIAYRLAGPIAVSMNHTPPPSVHPEPYLICVAAAYQRLHAGGNPAWGPEGPMGAYAPMRVTGSWADPVRAPGAPQGPPTLGGVPVQQGVAKPPTFGGLPAQPGPPEGGSPEWTGPAPKWEGPSEDIPVPPPEAKPF
jgi:uncharacterized RDD family membrane protein YckC